LINPEPRTRPFASDGLALLHKPAHRMSFAETCALQSMWKKIATDKPSQQQLNDTPEKPVQGLRSRAASIGSPKE